MRPTARRLTFGDLNRQYLEVFILLTVSLLATAPAPTALDKAISQYEQIDHDGAIKGFEALTASDQPENVRALAFMWLGITRADLGKFEASEKDFIQALEVDRNLALPVDMSPKVVELFAAAREKVGPAPVSTESSELPEENLDAVVDNAESAESSGSVFGPLLGYTALGSAVVTAVVGVGFVTSWTVGAALYQAAINDENAASAQETYNLAQTGALVGNVLLGTFLVGLTVTVVTTAGWLLVTQTE